MIAKHTGLSVAVLALSIVIASPASAADLIYSTWVSAEHHLTRNVVVPFAAELEEKTGGAVKFEIASGGALAKPRETLEAISNGTVDAGYIVDIYFPSSLPQTALLGDLALLVDDAVAATAAMNETVLLDCAECRASLENQNVVPIGFISTSTYKLQCTKPVAKLDDLRGLRVRATGAWAPMFSDLGATPVNIPISEVYEALQRGALDCSVGPVSHLPSYSLYEVVTDVNDMPMGAYAGGLTLNLRKEAWEALTAEQRALFLELAPKYVAIGIFGYNATDEEAAAKGREQGITWHPAAPDIKVAYDAYNAQSVAAVIAKGKADAAIGDAEALVKSFTENLEKWRGIRSKIGDDRAAFEQALRDEIYVKLN